MARLPQPGADNGTWGSILNDYLSQIHEGDGTLKAGTVQATTLAKDAVTSAAIATNSVTPNELSATGGADGQVLVKDSAANGGMKWASVAGGGGTVPSASSTTEGTLRLAGDLGGTAQAPTVPGLAGKADIATTYTKSQVDAALTAKQDKSALAPVATSGSYNDLTNRPTIPAAQVQPDWNATTGMGAILNKPTMPSAQVNANWTATSGVAQILNKPTLATVATTGDYNDLTNKPAPGSSTPVATTTATGTITLAGDLAGSGGAPTVAKVNGIAVTGTPTAGQVLKATSATAATWQNDATGSGGASAQTMNYIWANDDGTWPSAASIGTLSATNMVSFVVPPTALPGATRFPAPPISINSRYVLYYGPTPISATPSVAITTTAVSGRNVTFKATATLAEGNVSTYKWDFSDSTTATTVANTVSHVFPSTGSVSCTVTVTDNYNLTGTTSMSLTITEGTPTVSLSGAANGSDITWIATATDPEGATLSYAWTGTDSLTGTTASVTKTYGTGGVKSATVTVTDDKGTTNSATATVNLVTPDGNGIITADTFATAAADAAAIANRMTEPGSMGGTALKPNGASGGVRISGGFLEWQATQLKGTVTYPVGNMHPRVVATITGTTSSALPYLSFNTTNGSVSVNTNGDGSIGWARNVWSPAATQTGAFSTAPAGTWINGDRFDADLVESTGVLTVKQYRSGTLLATHTATVTAPNVSCASITIGSGRDYTAVKVDDVIIAVLP